ncbi:MAG: sulfite exporter TauE/SafE family protein [Candidatus Competibacteraceae bacterium]
MSELLYSLFFYMAIGAATGVVAGLLGVGGGLIIVPALAWIFHLHGMPEPVIMHLALGTSLATIIVTSISSVRAHHRHRAVLWSVFRQLAPGLVIGTLLGSKLAGTLRSDTLRIIFGIFELTVAAQMGFGFKPAAHRNLPGTGGMVTAGGLIGLVSAVVGIGGGSLTVPFLTWCNATIHKAVATSAACGLPIAIAGAVGYMITGWGHPELPPWSLGYVYGPALLGIALISMLSAPWGAKLAHSLPTATLRKAFAGFLGLVGIKMLIG